MIEERVSRLHPATNTYLLGYEGQIRKLTYCASRVSNSTGITSWLFTYRLELITDLWQILQFQDTGRYEHFDSPEDACRRLVQYILLQPVGKEGAPHVQPYYTRKDPKSEDFQIEPSGGPAAL